MAVRDRARDCCSAIHGSIPARHFSSFFLMSNEYFFFAVHQPNKHTKRIKFQAPANSPLLIGNWDWIVAILTKTRPGTCSQIGRWYADMVVVVVDPVFFFRLIKPGLINERMDCVMLRENIDVFPVGFVIARCFFFRFVRWFLRLSIFLWPTSMRVQVAKLWKEKNGGVRACQGAVSSACDNMLLELLFLGTSCLHLFSNECFPIGSIWIGSTELDKSYHFLQKFNFNDNNFWWSMVINRFLEEFEMWCGHNSITKLTSTSIRQMSNTHDNSQVQDIEFLHSNHRNALHQLLHNFELIFFQSPTSER